MRRLTDQILFLAVFGKKLLPELGEILENPQEYGRLLPQGHRAVLRALARMTTRGEVKRVTKVLSYQVTEEGMARARGNWPHFAKGFVGAQPQWDKRWRVVVFDIPERYRGLRAILRRFLVSCGFAGMQRSLWLAPFAVTDEVVAFLQSSRLDQMSLVMEVEKLWGSESVGRDIKISSYQAGQKETWVERIWKLGALREKYADFGMACGVAPGMTKGLQQQFAKLVFTDPWLPEELVKGNLGRGKAMEAYRRLIEKVPKEISNF